MVLGALSWRHQIIVILNHDQEIDRASSSLEHDIDSWELGKCRCRNFVSPIDGHLSAKGLIALDKKLRYEGGRDDYFDNLFVSGGDRAVFRFADGKLLLFEMKKETVMGARMIVVKVTRDPPLYELSGESCTSRTGHERNDSDVIKGHCSG